MVTCWPLDDINYTAKAIGAFAGTRTRGVVSDDDCLKCTSAGGRTILIAPGMAWLQKQKYWGISVLNDEPVTLTLEVASGTLSRYVEVVLRLDIAGNQPELLLRNGAFSTVPEKELPVRDAYYDEIVLHAILQRAGSVDIKAADIEDMRMHESYCGIMRDGVTGLPTQQISAQATAIIAQLRAARDTAESGAAPNGFYLYTHNYNAVTKVHNLVPTEDDTGATGFGTNGKMRVTAGIAAGDTFAVNGIALPAYTGADETDDLPVGRWVTFVYDGEQLNFSSGGSGVDFRVIAVAAESALPATAREKTLAVITSMAANGYAFSPETPAVATGRVWVKTQPVPASTGNAFNAAKRADKAVEISIAGVYQYDGSAWVSKAAKLYQGGAWVNVTYSVTYAQGRAGTFAPQIKPNLLHGSATPAFSGTVAQLPGFSFTGWSPAVASQVKEAATYTAMFNQDQYFVRYLPGSAGTFATQTYSGLRYGVPRPAFQGTATGSGLYDFAGWSPALAATVAGSVDYTAQWTHTPYYYSASNEYAGKTGGWVAVPFFMNGSYRAVTSFTKESDRMVMMSKTNGDMCTIMTSNPVNLTGVSFINYQMYATVAYPDNSNTGICICRTREIVFGENSNIVASWSFTGAYGSQSKSGIVSLDVRGLTGNYYIGAVAFSQGYYVQLSLYSIYGS